MPLLPPEDRGGSAGAQNSALGDLIATGTVAPNVADGTAFDPNWIIENGIQGFRDDGAAGLAELQSDAFPRLGDSVVGFVLIAKTGAEIVGTTVLDRGRPAAAYDFYLRANYSSKIKVSVEVSRLHNSLIIQGGGTGVPANTTLEFYTLVSGGTGPRGSRGPAGGSAESGLTLPNTETAPALFLLTGNDADGNGGVNTPGLYLLLADIAAGVGGPWTKIGAGNLTRVYTDATLSGEGTLASRLGLEAGLLAKIDELHDSFRPDEIEKTFTVGVAGNVSGYQDYRQLSVDNRLGSVAGGAAVVSHGDDDWVIRGIIYNSAADRVSLLWGNNDNRANAPAIPPAAWDVVINGNTYRQRDALMDDPPAEYGEEDDLGGLVSDGTLVWKWDNVAASPLPGDGEDFVFKILGAEIGDNRLLPDSTGQTAGREVETDGAGGWRIRSVQQAQQQQAYAGFGNVLVSYWTRAANPPALNLLGATWTDAGYGTNPVSWYRSPADIPADFAGNLYQGIVMVSRGPGGAWTFGTPTVVQASGYGVQFSVDGSTAWHAARAGADKYVRYRDAATGAWGVAVAITPAASEIFEWTQVFETAVNWTDNYAGALITFPAIVDFDAVGMMRFYAELHDSSGYPMWENEVLATGIQWGVANYERRAGQPLYERGDSLTWIFKEFDVSWVGLRNGAQGNTAATNEAAIKISGKFIKPAGNPAGRQAQYLQLYETWSTQQRVRFGMAVL